MVLVSLFVPVVGRPGCDGGLGGRLGCRVGRRAAPAGEYGLMIEVDREFVFVTGLKVSGGGKGGGFG